MILVIDTNVLLHEHRYLWELWDYFPKPDSASKFFIALDDQDAILNEYLEHSAGQDSGTTIREITNRILDGTGLFVISTPFQEKCLSLISTLNDCGCSTPIQHELFWVAASYKDGVLVSPNNTDPLLIKRDYLDTEILSKIQRESVSPVVWTLPETLRVLRQPHEHSPSTMDELVAVLKHTQLGSINSEERAHREFKCPHTFLEQRMLKDVVKATCGMLNSSRGGWVFIGVHDATGEPIPFPPRYGDVSKPLSTDQLVRDIYSEINRIRPKPGNLVDIWPIVDPTSQNCVIVIRVHKGSKTYLYQDPEKDKTKNKGIVKWIRQGASTTVDPNWQP